MTNDKVILTVKDIIDAYGTKNYELIDRLNYLKTQLDIKDQQIKSLLNTIMYLKEEDHREY